MKAVLILAICLATLTVLPAAAAEPGPCPGGGYSCTPPEPCGWAPNPVRDPVAYAQFWANCLN